MALAMTPTQWEPQMKLWLGSRARFFSGWQTRGYGPGSISNATGVLIHHTGSEGQSDDYLNWLANIGRKPDVPPPLCNFAVDRDGDCWTIAAERANHAGAGSLATLNHIKAKDYGWSTTELEPGPDNYTGNSYLYGFELRYDGSHPPSSEMWITAVLGAAAICHFHGWGAWRVIGHKEHTRRKDDPGHVLMYMFRRAVDAALKAGPGNWPQMEDDMANEGPQILALMQAEAKANAARYSDIKNTLTNWLPTKLGQAEAVANAADKARDEALAKEVEALTADVAKLFNQTP